APSRSALPRPFTSLVGREAEIAAIEQLLWSESGPILTLTGTAGVGKTRLAIAVAQHVADRFTDGVVFIDLSALTDSDAVLPVLLRAIGLPDGDHAAKRFSGFVSDRSMLLVIDNFEQLREAAPALNACLMGASGVRALITSQAPLNVSGERVYPVQPLRVAERSSARPLTEEELAAIATIPSIELFVRRAQTVRPSFELTASNAVAVAEVCRQLDGLPLAIELAAARSNILSPEALLTRLATPLGLLSAGPRDAPDRHRTLQSAIAWSVGLLPPDEALLFERLSVFAGSFALEAAEAVVGDAPIHFQPSFYIDPCEIDIIEPRIDRDRILDLLEALVDLGLVQRIEPSESEPRFRLFRAIRQFAAEALVARGATQQTALRHATWFRSRAEATWKPTGLPVLGWHWLGTLALDDDNLRAALDFLSETDPAMAAVFASSLGWYYYFSGQRLDGLRAMERVDGRYDPSQLSAVVRARIDHSFGVLLVQLPNRQEAGVRRFESMLATMDSVGLDWAAGFALLAMGIVAEDMGQYDRSIELCHGARERLAPLPDPTILPKVDVHIATASFGLGQHARAKELAIPIADAPPELVGPN
ncbi:MAG: AAA family ATPase, partial [Thermomicrobiales bacterium]